MRLDPRSAHDRSLDCRSAPSAGAGNEAELHDAAEALRVQLEELDPQRAIAAACRGSGNPAWLASLAEAVTLSERTSVVDVDDRTVAHVR